MARISFLNRTIPGIDADCRCLKRYGEFVRRFKHLLEQVFSGIVEICFKRTGISVLVGKVPGNLLPLSRNHLGTGTWEKVPTSLGILNRYVIDGNNLTVFINDVAELDLRG